jgi:hypothetical protein
MAADNRQTVAYCHLASGPGSFTIAPDVPSRHSAGGESTRLEESREHEPAIEPQARVTAVVRVRFQNEWHELFVASNAASRLYCARASGRYSSRGLS